MISGLELPQSRLNTAAFKQLATAMLQEYAAKNLHKVSSGCTLQHLSSESVKQ